MAAIKLDMSKAYDRVEWNFLRKVMIKMGFHNRWVDLIMKCVTTVSYRIKVNGEYTEQIYPQRGLRQGDPLSPYLFIICAEALSALLQKAEVDGSILGIKICRGAPRINHLFFADDSLIFMNAVHTGALELKNILQSYERASGQMINREKSSILFSPNTPQSVRNQICSILSIANKAYNERYLGLPVAVGKSRRKTFEYIKQRVWNRIQGWQERLLSKAGKEIMIKAVAQAIPTYAMSCFDLTKSVCDDLNSMIARYWWSQQDKLNKIHWLSWEKLTRSKKKGGLGFRDLHLFNMAMLSRQAWRLLTNPDMLCAQVLKAKYYPNKELIQCTARGGISYSWRSILKGLKLLKQGLIWRIGDGMNTNIWTDPWIPRGSTRRPATPRGPSLLTKVADLIDPGTGTWDEKLVLDTFWPEDAQIILNIPTAEGMNDWPAWHYDSMGKFSVKSAYKLAVQIRDQESGSDASSSSSVQGSDGAFPWQKIWHLKLPNKVNMFIWRMAHNSLPVRRNLARRGVKLDTICPVCQRLDEDCSHIFFKCKRVRACWRDMNLEEVRTELEMCRSGQETITKIWALDCDIQNKIFVFLWRWWSARNKANAGEKMASSDEICKSVAFHLMDIAKLGNPSHVVPRTIILKWKPPPADCYKVNVDASFHPRTMTGGWGFVARDCSGNFLEAGAGNFLNVASALQAEALAILRSIERVADLGMTRIILETDAATLGQALRSEVYDRSPNGALFRQIRDVMCSHFIQCIVSVCPRACNSVADKLAAHGASVVSPGSCIFMCHIPDFVLDLVSGDMPRASE